MYLDSEVQCLPLKLPIRLIIHFHYNNFKRKLYNPLKPGRSHIIYTWLL